MSESNTLLSIKDLHVHFHTRDGVVRALDGLDLDVYPDEVVGVVGESGCGKSVTGQSILRIVPKPGVIEKGKILFRRSGSAFGQNGDINIVDIARLPDRSLEMREIRRNFISVIFQEPMTSMSPVHTIGNQIIEAIRLKEPVSQQQAREQAIEMLDMVGIADASRRIDSYTFQLSGGMRQRAMIAMALVTRPSLLIADEPTTAIDVTIQAQILELLQRLRNELHMAVMIITHNLGVVAGLADRVIVMYRGRVVEIGSTRQIFHDPKHPYTRGLIRSVPKIREARVPRLWAIKGVVPHPYMVVPGCAFHPRCEHMIPGVCDRDPPIPTLIAPGHETSCYLYGRNDTENGTDEK